jgi:hypothetical protein
MLIEPQRIDARPPVNMIGRLVMVRMHAGLVRATPLTFNVSWRIRTSFWPELPRQTPSTSSCMAEGDGYCRHWANNNPRRNQLMRKLIIAAAILSATSLSALAQNNQGGNNNNQGGNVRGAPGPVLGAGLPVLAIGYGVYWLVNRRRRS